MRDSEILSQNLTPVVSELQQQVIKYALHAGTTNRYANYSAGIFYTKDAFLKASQNASPMFGYV